MPFYTVTSVTLSRLNSINAIDVAGYGYHWNIFGIPLEYLWNIFCRSVPPEFLRSALAPLEALVLIMVYSISIHATQLLRFSLSSLVQLMLHVSLYVTISI